MPIIKEVVTPNGAATTFHKVTSLTFSGDFSVGKVQVTSWKDQASYLNGAMPAWNWYPEILYAAFGGPPHAATEAALVADGSLLSSGVVVALSDTQDIEAVRARKRAEINAARWMANNTTFTFAGKEIAIDPLSRSDVNGTATEILNQGALPENWPGAWKAVDNTYVAIPDLATWKSFHHAMYLQGLDNFVHSQALKAYLDDPVRTVEEVKSVQWGMTIPASPPPAP